MPELSVRLLGAVGAERERIGYVRLTVHRAEYESLIRGLEETLGTDEFDRTWEQGEQLSLDRAMQLARRGRGRRRRPTTGWDALTPAELRVVEVVASGLSNAQIAADLFVSVTTIKTHVSCAFTKLGVSNRTELAAEAARRAAGYTA